MVAPGQIISKDDGEALENDVAILRGVTKGVGGITA
jgi:hypothetical protein